MASPARPLATCVLRWIYEQVSAILKLLKQFLMAILAFIDAQIARLRAWVAQWDLLAKAEEFLWNQLQTIINEIKNAMLSIPQGPLAEFCPEFYSYFLDPAIGLFDAATAALNVYRNRYKSKLSFLTFLDQQIEYWEQIKADLTYAIEVLDDAIHKALLVEAAGAVP
jgi:hypothetical protein